MSSGGRICALASLLIAAMFAGIVLGMDAQKKADLKAKPDVDVNLILTPEERDQLMAYAQSQAAQIAAMEAEIARLRKRLGRTF